MAVYLLRVLVRNLIILAHNSLIIVVVITFIGPGWTWAAIAAVPGLIILSITLFGLSVAIAILCTRFRDLPPVVQNLVAVAFL